VRSKTPLKDISSPTSSIRQKAVNVCKKAKLKLGIINDIETFLKSDLKISNKNEV